jgi:hypothetical protein
MANHIGKLRRSHVVGTYGPGGIVDFRAPGRGAPISGVIAGLEEWDASAGTKAKGLLHPQTVHEPRLEKRLMVGGFRLPPIRLSEDENSDVDVLPVVRFPRWLQCTHCDAVRPQSEWKGNPGKPQLFCADCTAETGVTEHVIPVRFITACEKGHLDEFPWQAWIGCKCDKPRIHLRSNGKPGLIGKIINCEQKGCEGKNRSLEGAFGKNALRDRKLRCHGHRPWLATAPEQCDEFPRVLQRGASNVYWGQSLSSLDIPPFSVDLAELFGVHATSFESTEPSDWPELIRMLKLEAKTGQPAAVLLESLRKRQTALTEDTDEELEPAEYRQFLKSESEPVIAGEFHTRPGEVPPELGPYLRGVVLAHRLREIRALVGFTRIHPPSGPFREVRQRLSPLYIAKQPWLPAVELRGEGIFIRFNLDAMKRWELLSPVVENARRLEDRFRRDLFEGEVLPDCSPRFLLLHSFSHALMRQLSLTCGYSSSALRERLYVGTGDLEMAGVMIHTGSPDSEGTLGGLVRQGRPDNLVSAIEGALMTMSWCSQDPLCIHGSSVLSSPRNGAACHACLLVPETSCQCFNTRLDRVALIGTPGTSKDERALGYFRELVDELR